MRIGIEGKLLAPQAAGIGRYSLNLVRALLALARREGGFELVVFAAPQSAPEILASLGQPCHVHACPARSSLVRARVTLPRALAREPVDVFHGLDHVGIPWGRLATPRVVTVHDLLPIRHPEWFSWRHRNVVRFALPRVVAAAARVLVPSESVRGDLLERGWLPPGRIVVVPEGCEERFNPEHDRASSERLRRRHTLPERYVLSVGTAERRKNLDRLLRAFARLQDRSLGLVLCGAPGAAAGRVGREIESLGLRGRVFRTGFVDDADLPQLYREAELFAFPSLDEGFGLPPLEAMGCGVPVLAADVPAVRETVAAGALLAEPTSVEALAAGMTRLLEDPALRERLTARGLARARELSWERTAQRTLEVYRSAV